MSADNGIYIGVFPTGAGEREYRVIHAQAIEDCDYGNEEMQDHYRLVYFGSAKATPSRDEAWSLAREMADEILSDYGVLEYGVSETHFERPLISKTVAEANEWLLHKWS